jgi:hypothetical protein
MVRGWPGAGDNTRARALGLPVDDSIDAIIRQYMDGEKVQVGRVQGTG